MDTLIADPGLSEEIIKERRRVGLDHHDEVWEGVYFVSPLADDEHQELVLKLGTMLQLALGFASEYKVRPGVNLARKAHEWKHDFRIPDVVVFRENSSAVCYNAFWTGGAELAIEIVSPNDKSREKLAFYEKIGTKELLIVDRDPWQLELFRLADGNLLSAGTATIENAATLASESVPLAWQMAAGKSRPAIVAEHRESGETWTL